MVENNHKSDWEEKLVAKIKEDGLSPKPRWHFLLKDYVVWASGVLALIIGAGAVAVVIYLLRHYDWELQAQMHWGFWEFFLLSLPYFWLLFLGIFTFILYYNIRHTRQGYRHPFWLIATGAFLASIFLGGFFYSLGWGEKIDNVLGAKVPLYETFLNRRMVVWHQPDSGRITGIIVSPHEAGGFKVMDIMGQEWRVIVPSNIAGELLQPGSPVSLMGSTTKEHVFQIKFIKPVRAGRGFMMTHPQPLRHLYMFRD